MNERACLSGGSRIIVKGGFLPPLENFSLFSQCIHSKKNYRGELRRGSSVAIRGARAPADPPLDPPLLHISLFKLSWRHTPPLW